MPIGNVEKTLEFLASKCSPPFREREIAAKIKSALTRVERRDRGVAEDIREWITSTSGRFLSTDVYRDLQLTTRREKQTCSQTLIRLIEEKVIEKHGDRAGSFRIVDPGCNIIDFMNIDASPINLKWPLEGLERMVEVYPGNIIVIAGEPNAGKTAMLLSFIYHNQGRHKIHYFSSEMGGMEIRKRLLMFRDMNLEDWKFVPREEYTLDAIEPDCVNIIDFLEIHTNFYEVGGRLKAIHNKLDKNKGIALVALQKNRFTEFGLGGQRGLEIPRLYLTISSEFPGGRLKIVKAKNWGTSDNPNQYSIKFKLAGGCYFVAESEWESPSRVRGEA